MKIYCSCSWYERFTPANNQNYSRKERDDYIWYWFFLRDGVTEHCEDEKYLKFISKDSWIMSAVTHDI